VPPLFPATLSLYVVACTLYLVQIVVGGGAQTPGSVIGAPTPAMAPGLVRAARMILALAFASHAVDIGWLCTKGLHPVVNAREALSFASWLMCGLYLALSLRAAGLAVVGAIVVPATLILLVAARLAPGTETPTSVGALGALHITLATAGVALFAVAAGGAVVYLLVERNIKKHKTGFMLRGGPALETLDKLSRRCIVIGFPVFTVAMVTGAMWVARLPGRGVFTAQYAISSIAWLVFAGLLVLRLTLGWRGRRAALLTLAGFAGVIGTLGIYFIRGVGGGA
jgi:ABC-type uncharacterized transport system permease subunit